MYNITEDQYREVLERIVEEVSRRDYYSGKITGSFTDGTDWELRLTAVIYNEGWAIQDIVPVWWEFHTYDIEDEFINDFQFYEIREIIKGY